MDQRGRPARHRAERRCRDAMTGSAAPPDRRIQKPADRRHCPRALDSHRHDRQGTRGLPARRPILVVHPIACRLGHRRRQMPMVAAPPNRAAGCVGLAGPRPARVDERAPRSNRLRRRWLRRPARRHRPVRDRIEVSPMALRPVVLLRHERAPPRAGPIPGRSDRPGMRSTGNTLPGARQRAARAGARHSSGGGDQGSLSAIPDRPRRRRTGMPARHRRSGALARSSRR